jgi:transposase-like protein
MSKRATRIQKQQARKMYEDDGESFAAIGRHFGFSLPTVSNWAKAGGWDKLVETETVGADVVGATIENVDVKTSVVDDGRDRSEADLRDRLRRLEARNKQLEDENQVLKPTVDISAMLGDRVKWLTDNSPEGEKYWLNRAEASFKKENRQRAKDGLPVFSVKEHPELLDELIVELKTKEAMAGAQEPTEPPSRRVKLLIMRHGMPVIEQIPMESQVNNMAGSLADGIIRYTRKGFKLTDPFLCPRAGCFKPAQNDDLGRWMYDGYCTDRHRAEVEGVNDSPTVGLQTKDTILSGIG